MWCAKRIRTNETRPFGVRVVVHDSIDAYRGGTIRCVSDVPQLRYEWYGADGAPCDGFAGPAAYDVPPGEYRIVVASDSGERETLRVCVGLVALPSVQGYTVTHATSDTARDGEIVASVVHCDAVKEYMWTNGVVTSGPTLRDVRPGTYTVAPIVCEDSCAFVHACRPAVVRSARASVEPLGV